MIWYGGKVDREVIRAEVRRQAAEKRVTCVAENGSALLNVDAAPPYRRQIEIPYECLDAAIKLLRAAQKKLSREPSL